MAKYGLLGLVAGSALAIFALSPAFADDATSAPDSSAATQEASPGDGSADAPAKAPDDTGDASSTDSGAGDGAAPSEGSPKE